MLRFLKKPKKRVCVIGLDGVPHSLIGRLTADGGMPTMAELANRGYLHKMKVTLPEISSVSWTSFMTGAGPGEHGIFGFIDLKPGGKEVRFPGFRDLQVPTLWDRLGERSKKSVVINQPSTYPARPIPGVLVSGFVALDLRKATHPPRLFVDLKRMNYELDIDTQRARVDSDYLIQSLNSTLQGRRAVLDLLWDKEDWDYFQLVVTGTDRLQHYLWNAIDDSDHPYHQAVRDYYRKVDDLVGEIVDRFQKMMGKDDGLSNLFLLSDHGFTGIEKEFNLNVWLRQEGCQEIHADGEPSLNDLSADSRAFALDPNRIYFNRKDRFADGCVDPHDIPALIEEMTRKLLELRCDGTPVVREVLRCNDIYQGSQTTRGPDLIVLTHYGYDAKSSLSKKELFSDTDLQGMHTWDDAFFWSAEAMDGELNIVDLAPMLESRLIG
ncbi:MAG: alkaline phosphatase family protein [bacterium]